MKIESKKGKPFITSFFLILLIILSFLLSKTTYATMCRPCRVIDGEKVFHCAIQWGGIGCLPGETPTVSYREGACTGINP